MAQAALALAESWPEDHDPSDEQGRTTVAVTGLLLSSLAGRLSSGQHRNHLRDQFDTLTEREERSRPPMWRCRALPASTQSET